MLAGYDPLTVLDHRVDKLLHTTAILTHDMVVMGAVIEFEYRAAALEVVPLHQTGGLELGQDPVDRRQPDIFTRIQQRLVDAFGSQVELMFLLQDLEDLDPWQRDLESGFPEIVALHLRYPRLHCARHGKENGSCYYYRLAPGRQRNMLRPPFISVIPMRLLTRLLARALGIVFLTASLAAASGCMLRNFTLKPYRINIQQGNFLEEEDVDQVQTGMTRSQVRFLLGTPMIEDVFNNDRWDYIYYLKIGRSQEVYTRHFIVFFEGDQAVRVEKDLGNTQENDEGEIIESRES